MLKIVNTSLLLLLVACSSACSTMGYYAQSIKGELEILQKSKPIVELLDQKKLPQQLLDKLDEARQIREFAINKLFLPDNGSYLRYADIGRKYVVWNVFAAPELSLDSKRWCYLVVGCLNCSHADGRQS